MNKAVPWMLAAAMLIGGALYYYWLQKSNEHPLAPAVVATAEAPPPVVPPVEPEPEQHFPAPMPAAQPTPEPLPALDASDSTVLADLAALMSAESIGRYVVPQQIIRNIVVTVDNLPRKSYALRLSPVRPVDGIFRTATDADGRLIIAPDNAARYAPYVAMLKAIPARPLVLAYGRLYPLFQEAYQDLGYPKGYFNDRLISVIDLLLATPESTGPIALVTPRVQAQFADPELEALPAGQKVLLRIGPQDAAIIKGKLREIRNQLTGAR